MRPSKKVLRKTPPDKHREVWKNGTVFLLLIMQIMERKKVAFFKVILPDTEL